MLCGGLPRKRVGETAAEGRVVRGLEEDRGGALLGAAMDGWIASLRTSERDELVVGGTGKGRVEGRVVVGRRRAGVARGMNDSVAPSRLDPLGPGEVLAASSRPAWCLLFLCHQASWPAYAASARNRCLRCIIRIRFFSLGSLENGNLPLPSHLSF